MVLIASARTRAAAIAVVCLILTRPVSPVPADDSEARIRRIEANVTDVSMGDKEPLRLDLRKLMDVYRVPGLSIAVVDHFRIVWAKAYGVLETGSGKPVTTDTLFQAGSISKPVAAAGALALVEQGKLMLDEDVNLKLKSWKVPENEFTKNEKVTLRRLMSHTGGLTVHGFPIRRGRAPADTRTDPERRKTGQHAADPRGYRAGHKRALLGRRRHHRAATHDRRDGHALSGIDARIGARQSRHGGQQLRATIAARTSGPDCVRD